MAHTSGLKVKSIQYNKPDAHTTARVFSYSLPYRARDSKTCFTKANWVRLPLIATS